MLGDRHRTICSSGRKRKSTAQAHSRWTRWKLPCLTWRGSSDSEQNRASFWQPPGARKAQRCPDQWLSSITSRTNSLIQGNHAAIIFEIEVNTDLASLVTVGPGPRVVSYSPCSREKKIAHTPPVSVQSGRCWQKRTTSWASDRTGHV